jgi:single-stranded DNA-binding protein
MSQVKATFSGGVVAEPERKDVGDGLLVFPVYVNDQKKVGEEYEATGHVTKIRVQLWGDMADTDIRKGDIVEVEGAILEREYERKDGGTGRSLETKYVNSVTVKYRRDDSAPAAASSGATGFASSGTTKRGF